MSRKKLKYDVASSMFGHTVSVTDTNGNVQLLGENIGYDPTKRFDSKLKEGYLFRNPEVSVADFATLWDTIGSLEGKLNIWIEQEVKKDKDPKTFAYALIENKDSATMFAFSHMEFQKWSKELDKDAKKEANRKPLKARVTKDGRIKVRVTTTTLKD
jgi:hypothetical protein